MEECVRVAVDLDDVDELDGGGDVCCGMAVSGEELEGDDRSSNEQVSVF